MNFFKPELLWDGKRRGLISYDLYGELYGLGFLSWFMEMVKMK